MLDKKALAAVLAALCLGVLLAGSPRAPWAGETPPLEGVFADNFTLSSRPVPAPQAGFTDLAGEPVRLADFAGRVVVLNFWATWCAPCLRELPSLQRLAGELGEKGLAVLAVSVDRGGANVVAPFLREQGLEALGSYLDPKGALLGAFRVEGLPTTFVIDAAGNVVGSLAGPAEWDSPEAKTLLRFYLQRAEQHAALTTPAQRVGTGVSPE